MKFSTHMKRKRFRCMNNFFKVVGLALAVHYIVKTVQKELKQ